MSNPYPPLYPHQEPTQLANSSGGTFYPYAFGEYSHPDTLIPSPPPPPLPPRRSHWKYWVGGMVVVLLVANALLVGYLLGTHQNPQTASPRVLATPTPPSAGVHISNVQLGKGDASESGAITMQTTTFAVGEHITIAFTATTEDTDASVSLKLSSASGTSEVLGSVPLDTGRRDYYMIFRLNSAGKYTAELQSNGTTESVLTLTIL